MSSIGSSCTKCLIPRWWHHYWSLRGRVFVAQIRLSRWTLNAAPTRFLCFLVHILSTAATGSHSQPLLTGLCSPTGWTETLFPASWGCSYLAFCHRDKKEKSNMSTNSFTRWRFCFSCLVYAFLIKQGNPTFLSSVWQNRTGSVVMNTAIDSNVLLTSFSNWGIFRENSVNQQKTPQISNTVLKSKDICKQIPPAQPHPALPCPIFPGPVLHESSLGEIEN